MAAAGFSPEKIASIMNREDGARLAMRALGYGSVLAITGVTLIAYLGWKLSGANNVCYITLVWCDAHRLR